MRYRDAMKPIRDHQIEELLLYGHIEQEAGQDLIEEYFQKESSLDLVTIRAAELIRDLHDPSDVTIVRKNLSECIVVKIESDRRSIFGLFRRLLSSLGVKLGKSKEVERAEKLIDAISKRAS